MTKNLSQATMEKRSTRREATSIAAEWLRNAPSRAATHLTRRHKTPRPVISEPFGPIHTSRGYEFSRSETLLVVDHVDDCIADKEEWERLGQLQFEQMEAWMAEHKPRKKFKQFDKKAPVMVLRPRQKSWADETVPPPPPPLEASSTMSLLPHNDENTPPVASG